MSVRICACCHHDIVFYQFPDYVCIHVCTLSEEYVGVILFSNSCDAEELSEDSLLCGLMYGLASCNLSAIITVLVHLLGTRLHPRSYPHYLGCGTLAMYSRYRDTCVYCMSEVLYLSVRYTSVLSVLTQTHLIRQSSPIT